MIPSLPCMHFEKKNGATKILDYAFGQTSSLLLPFTRIRTLLIEPNLKISTIMFVLRYISYKGHVKSQIWDSKVYHWLYRQVNHKLQRQMQFFCNFSCFLKWNLRCTFKCSNKCFFRFTFYWIVLGTLLH